MKSGEGYVIVQERIEPPAHDRNRQGHRDSD
jgi:hypothetical protein